MTAVQDAVAYGAEVRRLKGTLRLARKLNREDVAEIARLTEALHYNEAHPDFEYASGDNSARFLNDGWAKNVHSGRDDTQGRHWMRPLGNSE